MSELNDIQFHYDEIDFALENDENHINWLIEIANSHSSSIGQLNYIFCSDEKILEINKAYLDHDYYTDIISFPYEIKPISGDIYISIDRVKENAEALKLKFEEELLRVMSHGLLHFLGFDDHSDEDIVAMRDAENKAIEQFKYLG